MASCAHSPTPTCPCTFGTSDPLPHHLPCECVGACGHGLCMECAEGHVSAKASEGTFPIKCPMPGCQQEIDPEVCLQLLKTEKERDLFGKVRGRRRSRAQAPEVSPRMNSAVLLQPGRMWLASTPRACRLSVVAVSKPQDIFHCSRRHFSYELDCRLTRTLDQQKGSLWFYIPPSCSPPESGRGCCISGCALLLPSMC